MKREDIAKQLGVGVASVLSRAGGGKAGVVSRRHEYFVHETKPGGGDRRLDGPFSDRRMAEAVVLRLRLRGINAYVVRASRGITLPLKA
jgi:hypothetical protein